MALLHDIIKKIDHDKILVQSLNGSITDLKQSKNGTKITFLSQRTIEELYSLDGTPSKKIGIVLWLDREDVENLKSKKAKPRKRNRLK